mmetsp:Transcript_29604/g.45214  ORF Transcript_29604/g.45214 Transcript_29604/m.45214 type:complete len:90 (-) Transcript_29604:873-1142(-)
MTEMFLTYPITDLEDAEEVCELLSFYHAVTVSNPSDLNEKDCNKMADTSELSAEGHKEVVSSLGYVSSLTMVWLKLDTRYLPLSLQINL